MRSTDQLEGREAHSTDAVDKGEVSEPGFNEHSKEEPVWDRTRLHRWLRLGLSFPVMLTVLLVTLQFMMSHRNVADPDIWWHLRNAEYLFQHHQLPRFDMYSFTVAGHPWINHEWLSEVPYYLAWRVGGLAGINAVMFGVISLIFLGLRYLCYRETVNSKASVV